MVASDLSQRALVIVSREDVRLRVMQELMRDPQSGAAHYLRDLRAQNLSPEGRLLLYSFGLVRLVMGIRV